MAKEKAKKEERRIEGKKISLATTEEIMRGTYVNFTLISHTSREFVLDFFLRLRENDTHHVSRILTSPEHAQALLDALKRNLEGYKKQFGAIKKKDKKKT